MSLKYIFLGFSLMIEFSGFSQKRTTYSEQVWFSYLNQTRFSNRWGLSTDFQLRTKEEFFNNFSEFMASMGLVYYLNDNARLTAAYSYVDHFPSDNHKNISQPEHRPWQQVQWFTRYQRLRLMQWIRVEERFRRKIKSDSELDEGYNFNWRFRYNFLTAFSLSKKPFVAKSWSFILSDELHINAGKEIQYNYFDQNRIFAGFNYQVNSHDNIQFGYMNLFQQLSSGNKYRGIHVARVSYFQNLNFRNTKMETPINTN